MSLQQKNQLEVNYPEKSFTFKNLEECNPNVSGPTLRIRLKKALEDGIIMKSNEILRTGRQGRGEYIYSKS